ncbi:hypothetical protein ACFVYP_33145 [Kitasatospora sp. NPDC058201]|uniref:hypothetical protein n=1 Tax=unclassified Kitasatospora TaxID=2633591 RepID=UPI0036476DC4
MALAVTEGAALCLAGHLPGPVRPWAPHTIALTVLVLMVPLHARPRVLLAGAAAVAAACLWTAFAGCPARRPGGVVELAAMAVLTAAASARACHADGTSRIRCLGAEALPPPDRLLGRRTGCRPPRRTVSVSSIWSVDRAARRRLPYRSVVLSESGGLVMVVGMAATLA